MLPAAAIQRLLHGRGRVNVVVAGDVPDADLRTFRDAGEDVVFDRELLSAADFLDCAKGAKRSMHLGLVDRLAVALAALERKLPESVHFLLYHAPPDADHRGTFLFERTKERLVLQATDLWVRDETPPEPHRVVVH